MIGQVLMSSTVLHRCVPTLGINVTEAEQAAVKALNLQQVADLSLRIFGTLVRCDGVVVWVGGSGLCMMCSEVSVSFYLI
jgi:hypothetical protein